jgi:VCBS repeat-containing protein
MFIVGKDGDDVNEYTLSTGYDVSTASYDSNFSVSSQDAVPQDIVFNTDGTKMFILGEGNDAVYEYTLSTGFDVSTASYDSNFSIASQETSPQGLAFNNDGTKMFVVGGTGDDVNEYTLSTGFDVSTASFVDSFDISSQDTAPNGLVFNSDGTKMFVTGNTGNDINEYTLSTGFDVSTASFVGNISVSSQDTTPGGIKFNHDGTKLFMVGVAGADINEYTLTSPFSLVNVSGEHTGDVIDSSNTSTRDTDVDVETLTVTAVRLGSSEGSGTAGSVGSALTGTYGQLTLNANGSYTYVANQTAADALDAGDVVTDSFNYTVSDGAATDIAVITITVIGINDTPTAQNDVGVIVEDGTLTVTNGANATLSGSYDATGENSGDLIDTSSSSHTDSDSDTSDSLTITQIMVVQILL